MEYVPFTTDSLFRQKLMNSYTEIYLPRKKNLGRVTHLATVFGVKFIAHEPHKAATPLILLGIYFLFNLLFSRDVLSSNSASYLSYINLFLLITVAVLLVAIVFTDPGFISYPTKVFSKNVVCDLCFTTKDDNCKHCHASGICVRGFIRFSQLLGTCITEDNVSRVYALVSTITAHVIFMTLVTIFRAKIRPN